MLKETEKMRIIIWGTGLYCKEKAKFIKEDDIVAFVEREKTIFYGKETILPEEIENYQYDKIVIMSNHYLDIIPELLEQGKVKAEKIIPGIAYKPYLPNELDLMSNNARIEVNNDGSLLYIYNNKDTVTIKKGEDWEQVRKLVCREENSKRIQALDVVPVSKTFGLQRGGSICRYYIDRFLNENEAAIHGKVLEIGDRTYTERYRESVQESYCLHFDKSFPQDGPDFYGDLSDGTGMKKDFYDCMILTQVLNFIEDIKHVPRVLVNSLKSGGVLLVTVAGITPISRFDMDRWGHFWNFTDAGIRKMFSMEGVECQTAIYGNYKAACAFLGGMSYTELDMGDLEFVDEDFQVIIAAVIRKTGDKSYNEERKIL